MGDETIVEIRRSTLALGENADHSVLRTWGIPVWAITPGFWSMLSEQGPPLADHAKPDPGNDPAKSIQDEEEHSD